MEMEEFRLFIDTQRQNQQMTDEIKQLKQRIFELQNDLENANELKDKSEKENTRISHELGERTSQLEETLSQMKKLKTSFEQSMKQNLQSKKRI